MRAGRIFILLAVAAAALPSPTYAGARADYEQTFSTAVPGASAGTDTQILYKHPDDPSAKPIPVRREVFTFPAGTTFDGSVVPVCKASDTDLELQGKAACPPDSWVGGGIGDTSMTGFPGDGETPLEVDGFNYGSGLAVLGAPKQYPQIRSVARVRWEGRVNTVDVPRTPGGPPDGESALRRVHNVFGARSLGQRAFVRTPDACPSSSVWTFEARFTFDDGAVETDVYRMPCTRAPAKRRTKLIRSIRVRRRSGGRLSVVVTLRARGRVRVAASRGRRTFARGSRNGRIVVIRLRGIPPTTLGLRISARVGGQTQVVTRRVRRAPP